MNAKEMIILTYKSDVAITLITRENIMKIQKFKKSIIFKVISKRSKKILKSNDF